MCCCEQKTLHGCGYGLIFWSLVVCAAAVVTILVGMKAAEDNILVDIANEDATMKAEEITQALQFLVGVSALLIIFVSVLGCCAGYLRNKCCLGTYGFFALVIMILCLLGGGMTLGLAAYGKDYCTKDISTMDEQERETFEQFIKWTDKIDNDIGRTVNENMCSWTCPCYTGDNDENYDVYSAISEETLNKYNRTHEVTFTTSTEDGEYLSFIWSNDRDLSFETLDECAVWLDENGSSINIYGDSDEEESESEVATEEEDEATPEETPAEDAADEDDDADEDEDEYYDDEYYYDIDELAQDSVPINEDNKKFISYFENKYKCSGFCKPPLFYYTVSINQGPPTQGCFDQIVTDVEDLLNGLGLGPMVAGCLLFFSFFCMYPICGYNRDEHLKGQAMNQMAEQPSYNDTSKGDLNNTNNNNVNINGRQYGNSNQMR